LRVAAIDDVGNRWGEVERTIDVERLPGPEPVVAARAEEPAPRKKRREAAEATRAPASNAKVASASFWATPWPWVAIGTAVVGIGGACTFALVDVSGPVRVAAPTVTTGP
jgi:hypothetical protein